MKILIIHEIDWEKKVIFEPHHFAELLSLLGNDVFVIDCPDPNISHFFNGLHTEVLTNYHRVYDNAKITLIHPRSFRIKGLNRFTNYLTCEQEIKKTILEKKSMTGDKILPLVIDAKFAVDIDDEASLNHADHVIKKYGMFPE